LGGRNREKTFEEPVGGGMTIFEKGNKQGVQIVGSDAPIDRRVGEEVKLKVRPVAVKMGPLGGGKNERGGGG